MKIKEKRENIGEKATAPNWRSVINTGHGGMEKLSR
jgi:hypothetical protein